jgi:hypothetical protein
MPVERELVGDDDQEVAVVVAALDLLRPVLLVDAVLESLQEAVSAPIQVRLAFGLKPARYASTFDFGAPSLAIAVGLGSWVRSLGPFSCRRPF